MTDRCTCTDVLDSCSANPCVGDLLRERDSWAELAARLLEKLDPNGFMTRDLGVEWVDDGSGFARRLRFV